MGSPTTASADPDTESSAAIQSLDDTMDETTASESQILNRSDVFQVPTIHAPAPLRSLSEFDAKKLHRASQDTARSAKPRPDSPSQKSRPKLKDTPPSFTEQDMARMQGSSSSIQRLMRAGMSPLQTATGIAGFLGGRSKRMSSILASESMGYYEKVAGMWAGGGRHYNSAEGLRPDDNVPDDHDAADYMRDANHFREYFVLPDTEQLLAYWHCSLHRVLPVPGKLYLGTKWLCWGPFLPKMSSKVSIRRLSNLFSIKN